MNSIATVLEFSIHHLFEGFSKKLRFFHLNLIATYVQD